jgi:hypothetical protein
MKLVLVKLYRGQKIECTRCRQMKPDWRSVEEWNGELLPSGPMYADMDGPPHDAYYCDPCAGIVGKTTGNRLPIPT